MFTDTSVLIEIFASKPTSRIFRDIYERIEDEDIFISVIQLGEISDWCFRNRVNREKIISELREIVAIMELDEDIVLDASKLKYERRNDGIDKFGLVDGIILASSRLLGEKLMTYDTDFRGLDDVILLEKK